MLYTKQKKWVFSDGLKKVQHFHDQSEPCKSNIQYVTIAFTIIDYQPLQAITEDLFLVLGEE
jgi:hypothetical protein